jgi:vanillate/3-O-methylgallate O-demethylase
VENIALSAYQPFDPRVNLYVHSRMVLGFNTLVPVEYTNWRDEALSWKQTCYISAGLNPSGPYRIKGPDAVRLLSKVCVNSFDRFPVGQMRHGITCTESGLVLTHGVLMRVAEDEFVMHDRSPYIEYQLKKGGFDATGEQVRYEFLFQVAGPRSLEVLERATGECLHDIRFARHRPSTLAGVPVQIVRIGMAGTLSYEVHGKAEHAKLVYQAIFDAGEAFGIRKLGRIGYGFNHTETGFAQSYLNFLRAYPEDPGFMEYMAAQGGPAMPPAKLRGSMGDDLRQRYCNPVELGWATAVKLNHDFIGREALARELESPRRQMVTLVWNIDDVMDVHRSQYEAGEHYLPLDGPVELENAHFADQVLKDGRLVGMSTGRMYSYSYRCMMTLCSLDVEHCRIGTEVGILWGEPGTRQKLIRATVERFPYLDENRNENVDVSTIPCIKDAPG